MDNSVNFVLSESIHIEFPSDNVEAEYGHPRSMGSVPVVNQVCYNNIPTEGDGNQPTNIGHPRSMGPVQIEVNQDGYNNIPAPSTDQVATVVEQLLAIGQSQTTAGDGNQPADIPGNQSSTSDNEDVPESLKQRFICDQCGKVLYSKSGFKTHIAVVHKGYKCTCKICGVSMKYPTNLVHHMRAVHKMGAPILKKNINRVCPKCSKKFTSNFLMYHHLKTVHKVAKPHECSLCDDSFSTCMELSTHKIAHPELTPFACHLCPLRYTSKINLEKHREKNGHYETADSVPYSRKDQCQKCKKVFTSYQAYKYHVSNLEGTCSRDDDRDICKCCGQVFENKSNLKEHHILKHKDFIMGNIVASRRANVPSRKANIPCSVCNKLLTQAGIDYHAKLHAGIRPHKCDQCDYRAILAQDIGKHKRYIHNKERRHACPFCCRRFRSRAEEKSHREFHFGVNRFECKICQKKYNDHRRCNDHEKLCKIGKAGNFSVNPIGVVAFRCRWCGGVYSTSSTYNKHAKTCKLKGGTDYEVRKKEDLEKAFDEMQQRSQEDQADKQEREKQELDNQEHDKLEYNKQEADKQEHDKQEHDKLECNKLEADKQEHDKQEQRPDFLPWCKYCSGIFKNHRSFKRHNYSCRIDRKKERAEKQLGTGENSSDDDNNINGDDDDDEDDEIIEKKPITIKIVKPPKPKRRTSPCKRKRIEQNQRDLATDKIFSPFSFSCEVCGKATEDLIKEFCPEHYTFCSFCEKSLKYDENLKMHLKEHLEKQDESKTPNSLVCKTCRKTTEELVEAHISKHPYHCLKCKLTFTAENQLRLHNREHRILVVYRCKQCTDTFTNKKKFKMHLHEHLKQQKLNLSEGVKFKLVCPSCPVQFQSKVAQDLHEQTVHGKVLYKCCSGTFETLFDFRKHQATKTHKRNVLQRARNRCVNSKQRAELKEMMNFDAQILEAKSGTMQAQDTKNLVVFQIGSQSSTSLMPKLGRITQTHSILRSALTIPSEADLNIPELGPITQPLEEQDLDTVSVDLSSPSQIINNVQTSILPMKSLERRKIQIIVRKNQSDPDGAETIMGPAARQSAPGTSSSSITPEGSTPSTSNAETNLQKTPSGVLFQSAPGASSSSTAPEGSTPSTSNATTNLQKTPSGVLFQCPHCQKLFSIERNLHVHMRSEMPYPCSFCIMSYKTRFDYDMHLMDKHTEIWKLM